MPLYLVRWPDLKASLVRAASPEELVDILDEVADAGGCTWTQYSGPLWIDFDVPVDVRVARDNEKRPLVRDEIDVEGADRLAAADRWLQPSIPRFSGTATAMYEKIVARAFPNLATSLDDEAATAEDLRARLLDDLDTLIKHDWRSAQLERRSDPGAQIMKLIGTTTPIPSKDPLNQ